MNQCNYGLTGRIVIPADPFYNVARQGFNHAIQQYPLILVYCQNKFDVSNAVKWARACNVPLRVRNGGHNYEGYSNGNCTLVIDISEMHEMSLDENLHVLQVQGGATNQQIYQFVSAQGYPFAGGTCPTVGISGYVGGGGWGLSCRWLGLGCDSVMEIELINYEGDLLIANRTCHSDLFWACRGAGGGNFGVIVSIKFQLPPKVDFVTLIEIDYLNASTQRQEEFLQTWQSWLPTADPRATLIARVYNSPTDGLAMLVRGIFYGTAQQALVLMQPFLLLPGARSRFEAMPFLQAVTIIGSGYPPYEKFDAVSRYAVRQWSPTEISQLAELVATPAQGSVFAGLSLYALDGRVAEVPPDETAFFYRNASFIVWLETIWEDSGYRNENREWIRSRFPTLASATTGSYINFPYRGLPNYREEYFGAHVPELWQIKKRYDPYNVFTFPQGIWGAPMPLESPAQTVEPHVDTPFLAQQDASLHRSFRYV